MNIIDTYKKGQKVLQEKHREEAKEKAGCLRVGSGGCVTKDGDVLGCPRKSLLRKYNLDMPIDFSTMLMFEGGHRGEEAWSGVMAAALPNSTIKREEEIPVEFVVNNGTRVTGRPDMVIGTTSADGAFVPELGIELKEISSLWTIRSVVFDGQPKTANLIQAATYSMLLGIPYKLCYTSRNIYAIDGNGWMAKIFPKIGTPEAAAAEYNEKGNIKSVRPLMCVYDLSFDKDGRLCYAKEGSDVVVTTTITKDGIKEYFESVSTMEADNDIGPRPAQLDALGNKESYSACQYCDLRPMCDTYESAGLNTWLKHVQRTYGR